MYECAPCQGLRHLGYGNGNGNGPFGIGIGIEAGGAGEGVAVDQGDGGETEFDRAVDEVFGLRGAFEEGEGGGAVEFGVFHGSGVHRTIAGLKRKGAKGAKHRRSIAPSQFWTRIWSSGGGVGCGLRPPPPRNRPAAPRTSSCRARSIPRLAVLPAQRLRLGQGAPGRSLFF